MKVTVDQIEFDGEHITIQYKTYCTSEDMEISVDGIVYGSKEWRDKYIGKYWYQRLWRRVRNALWEVGYYLKNIIRAIKGKACE